MGSFGDLDWLGLRRVFPLSLCVIRQHLLTKLYSYHTHIISVHVLHPTTSSAPDISTSRQYDSRSAIGAHHQFAWLERPTQRGLKAIIAEDEGRKVVWKSWYGTYSIFWFLWSIRWSLFRYFSSDSFINQRLARFVQGLRNFLSPKRDNAACCVFGRAFPPLLYFVVSYISVYLPSDNIFLSTCS